MSELFKIGDVVALKSGGPDMTVSAVEEPVETATAEGAKVVKMLHVRCVWFDENNDHLRDASFLTDMLGRGER